MSRHRTAALLSGIWLFALGACAPPPPEAAERPADESACYVAPDSLKCRHASAMAGGVPMQVNGTDR